MIETLTCSVIVPTCDRTALLLRAVESATRDQTRRPREIIIVDDCSRIDVRSVLSAADIADVPMIVDRLPRRSGAPVARNRGAQLATGDVVMFLDDDDFWLPEKIDRQMQLLEQFPQCGWVYTGMRAVDETDGHRLMYLSDNQRSGDVWPNILERNFVGPTSGVAIRRYWFDAVGGFDELFPAAQDLDLWIRLAQHVPVLFDGQHNLSFRAMPFGDGRLSSGAEKYAAAFSLIDKKYHDQINALEPAVVRGWRINKQLITLTKLRESGHMAAFWKGLLALAMTEPGALKRILIGSVNASKHRWQQLMRSDS